MVLITIVNRVYKPTYNWGAPHCTVIFHPFFPAIFRMAPVLSPDPGSRMPWSWPSPRPRTPRRRRREELGRWEELPEKRHGSTPSDHPFWCWIFREFQGFDVGFSWISMDFNGFSMMILIWCWIWCWIFHESHHEINQLLWNPPWLWTPFNPPTSYCFNHQKWWLNGISMGI